MASSRAWIWLSIATAFIAFASPKSWAPPIDEIPPSTPGNFRVTSRTDTIVNLAWNASTDNRGVTEYWVHRCQTTCSYIGGTTTGLALTVSAPPAGVTYLFQVRALDAAGNQSDPAELQVSTVDNIAPSAPSGLTATPQASGTSVQLGWTGSTDNLAVAGYAIDSCVSSSCTFTQHGTSTSTSYTAGSLVSGVAYQFRVRAYDAASNYSSPSNIAPATTVDVVPPGVPANLTTPSATGSSITLNWSAASDNVGILNYDIIYCAGGGCSPSSLFATTGATSYTANGLSPATWYSFQVRARDTSSITGGYSGVASRMTNDTISPSVPGSLTATPLASGTEVNLGWTASSDNIGVSFYGIERCNDAPCSSYTQIATTPTPGYGVLGLTPATTYRFQVRAYDAANNFSTAAGPVPVSTPDTIPPSTPGTLSATPISTSRIDLSWGASTDNVGVALYAIQRCQGVGCVNFTDLTTTPATTFSDTGLADTTTYNYQVRARDAAGVWSQFTNTAGAQTFDGQVPSTPSGLVASPVSGSGTALNLSWTASIDNVAVTGYAVDRCQGASCINFVEIALPTTNGFADSGLANGGTYNYRVRARDARANWSLNSAVATGTANDTQLPTAPSGLAVSVGSATQLNLTWTAATDNVGVTLYSIQRCQGASCSNFADVGTSTTTSFASTGLAPATTYRFQVRARDATNWGPYSNQAAQTTPADGQAPTAPTGLTVGTRTVTQINLSWTASTDNIGVTQYVVQRCTGTSCTPSTDVGTSTTTSYADNSLTPGTTYRYQVRARDAASNTSGASNVVSAATLADGSAPSTPTIVITGTTVTTVTMTLSATDNVGVTSYQLDRCTGAGCATWSQIAPAATSPYTDTGRAPATTYQYRARARDAAGNTSVNSASVPATTPVDNSPPSTPGNLRSPSKTATSVSLAWDASTDNVAVTSYRIQRCTGAGCNSWAEVGSTTTATTFTSSGLTQLTTYRFRVGARDGASQTTYTGPLPVTTNDGQAPTSPGGLTLTVTPGQILLQWNASTDNVGVTAYLVERCNTANCTYAQIANVGSTSYLDTTVASATNYTYRVAARDLQGNTSTWATTVPAQSADCD